MSPPLVTHDAREQGQSKRVSRRGGFFEPTHDDQDKLPRWVGFGRRRGLILGAHLTSLRLSQRYRSSTAEQVLVVVRHPKPSPICVSGMLWSGDQSSFRE
jgi:hypothetical protein